MSKKKASKQSTVKDMVEEVVEDTVEVTEASSVPKPTDPKWVDYVLDQLADHELISGSPTTDGLRRVTEKVFGEIVESDTTILEIPKLAFSGKASAKHTLRIRKYGHTREAQSTWEQNDDFITVSACVDVLGERLPSPFNQHLVSTACTRAEGKALRRALKIRVQTAEELANSDDDDSKTLKEPINDQQIVAIKTMCKRNDVDLIKFVRSYPNSDKVASIREVKNLEGRLMINKLSSFQREGTPEEFAGYNDNWEEEFGV